MFIEYSINIELCILFFKRLFVKQKNNVIHKIES